MDMNGYKCSNERCPIEILKMTLKGISWKILTCILLISFEEFPFGLHTN